MGFKLGSAKTLQASQGELKCKLSFNRQETQVPGTDIIRKNLATGVLGEANMDGSIYISNQIQPGSKEEMQVLLHEMRHSTDMKTGKLAYNDDAVEYNGITYPRETRNGKDMIKVDGKWTEAGGDFPWENDANI
mgnify:CR=1 FL=1|tara:strand:+ start:24 stop:425 length:402 start_codon:yes stop_codon:yes gene_type:complete